MCTAVRDDPLLVYISVISTSHWRVFQLWRRVLLVTSVINPGWLKCFHYNIRKSIFKYIRAIFDCPNVSWTNLSAAEEMLPKDTSTCEEGWELNLQCCDWMLTSPLSFGWCKGQVSPRHNFTLINWMMIQCQYYKVCHNINLIWLSLVESHWYGTICWLNTTTSTHKEYNFTF